MVLQPTALLQSPGSTAGLRGVPGTPAGALPPPHLPEETADAFPGLSFHLSPAPPHPPPRFHTKGTKKEPHCGPGALPWLPVLAFPQKSPSIPKHVPQNHRARPPTTKLVVPHSRAPRTTGAQALVLAHMRTGPRPRPLATRGVPNDRRGRAGACRKATARAPRVGEVSPGREDAQPRVSLTPSAPHSRQAEAGLAPDRSAPAGGAPPPRPI